MALSVHEAVEKLSSDPKNHEILFNAYLDSNPKETKTRFQASEEWAEIMKSVKQVGEPGFIFTDNLEFCYNPCVSFNRRK